MSKLLIRFSLLWNLVLFLAPVPTLGNFDSGDCTVDDSPATSSQCEAGVDLYFLIDSTGSLGINGHETMKRWAADLVDNFAIGTSNSTDLTGLTRVAVIQFWGRLTSLRNPDSRVDVDIQLGNYANKNDLDQKILSLDYRSGRSTIIPHALAELNREIERHPDPTREIYAIVLTDGVDDSRPFNLGTINPRPGNLSEEANRLKAKTNVTVFAIGFGVWRDINNLVTIASSEGNVITAEDVGGALNKTYNRLITLLCPNPSIPTPPTPDGDLVTSVTPICSNDSAAVEVVARSFDDIKSEDGRHRSLHIRIDYICIQHDGQQIRGTPWTTDRRINVTNLDTFFGVEDENNPQFTATVQQSLQQGTNCTFYLCYRQRTADSDQLGRTSPVSCVIPDINECDTANGGCEHNCTNNAGSFNCSCDTGYQLDRNGFNCNDIDECANDDLNNCHENANCTNTGGSFNCSCNDGYSGSGTECTDINECDTANGGCEHNCTNNAGSFNCSCDTGYQLDRNGFNCNDIDECANDDLNNCHEDANCTNTGGSFNCSCNDGYSGSGTECTDINECDTANGGCEHNCTNNAGSFNCSCDTGYQLDGNGFNCNDIDECANDDLNNCHEDANCTNTGGSFNCSCNDGYSGSGTECTDIDECETGSDNCDENAQCTNAEGSFTCSCNSGYTGDGTECSVVLTVVVVLAGFIGMLLTIITILCGTIYIKYKLWEMDAKRSKVKVYFNDDVVDLNYSPISPFSTSKHKRVASITSVFDMLDIPDRQLQISNAHSDRTLGTAYAENHASTSASTSKDRVHSAKDMQSSSVCVSDVVVSDVHEASHTSAVETFTGDNTTVCKSAERNSGYVHRDHLLQGSHESPDLNCVELESEFLQSTCLEVAEEVNDLQPHSVLLEVSKDEEHLAKEEQSSSGYVADTVTCAATHSSAVEPFAGDSNDTGVYHSGEQNDEYVRSEYLLQGSHGSPDMNSHIVELEPEFLQSMYLEEAVDQQSHSVNDMAEASKELQFSSSYLSDTHLLSSVLDKPNVVDLQGLEDSSNHSVVEDDLSIGKMSPQLFSENYCATSDSTFGYFDNTTHSVSQVQHPSVNRGYITGCSKSIEDIPHTMQQMN